MTILVVIPGRPGADRLRCSNVEYLTLDGMTTETGLVLGYIKPPDSGLKSLIRSKVDSLENMEYLSNQSDATNAL